jgi:hypothetical protein
MHAYNLSSKLYERKKMDHEAVELEAASKGLTAPHVTIERIKSLIADEQYYVFPGTTVTVCLLTLANGYSVTGVSAAASPSNFDEELGRKIARGKAENSIWPLEGYLLRQRFSEEVIA